MLIIFKLNLTWITLRNFMFSRSRGSYPAYTTACNQLLSKINRPDLYWSFRPSWHRNGCEKYAYELAYVYARVYVRVFAHIYLYSMWHILHVACTINIIIILSFRQLWICFFNCNDKFIWLVSFYLFDAIAR